MSNHRNDFPFANRLVCDAGFGSRRAEHSRQLPHTTCTRTITGSLFISIFRHSPPTPPPLSGFLLFRRSVVSDFSTPWSVAPPGSSVHGCDPWVGKIPWRRARQPTPAFLPGESHGQRGLAGYSPCRLQRVGHDWMTKHSTHRSINPLPSPYSVISSQRYLVHFFLKYLHMRLPWWLSCEGFACPCRRHRLDP